MGLGTLLEVVVGVVEEDLVDAVEEIGRVEEVVTMGSQVQKYWLWCIHVWPGEQAVGP